MSRSMSSRGRQLRDQRRRRGVEGKVPFCVACGKTIVKRGPTRSNGAFYRKHPWWTTYHVKCYELLKSKKDPKE